VPSSSEICGCPHGCCSFDNCCPCSKAWMACLLPAGFRSRLGIPIPRGAPTCTLLHLQHCSHSHLPGLWLQPARGASVLPLGYGSRSYSPCSLLGYGLCARYVRSPCAPNGGVDNVRLWRASQLLVTCARGLQVSYLGATGFMCHRLAACNSKAHCSRT